MSINYVLVMHKILTVWTKFLHTFILWMLLSKSNFLNEVKDNYFEIRNNNMQTNSRCFSHTNFINRDSSIFNKMPNKQLPNIFIQLINRTLFYDSGYYVIQSVIRSEVRTVMRSAKPSNLVYEGIIFSKVVQFPIDFLTTFNLAASQTLPDFTTENGIFTGLPKPTSKPMPPLREFEVSINETFGTFVYLQISWNSTFNVTKIELRFINVGEIIHHIEIPTNFLAQIENVFSPPSGRIGFIYHLGGLAKSRRYYLQAWGFPVDLRQELYDKQSFLTADKDIHDSIYDLNGIFMVLGMSTILMIFVMGCVGYEKLIHQKKRMVIDSICCRNRKLKNNRVHDSISPEPLTRDHNIEGLPSLEEEYVRAGPSRAFGF